MVIFHDLINGMMSRVA